MLPRAARSPGPDSDSSASFNQSASSVPLNNGTASTGTAMDSMVPILRHFFTVRNLVLAASGGAFLLIVCLLARAISYMRFEMVCQHLCQTDVIDELGKRLNDGKSDRELSVSEILRNTGKSVVFQTALKCLKLIAMETALTIAFFLEFVLRSGRKIKKTRKYDIITTPAEKVEMTPLNEDDDDDEDATVFDINPEVAVKTYWKTHHGVELDEHSRPSSIRGARRLMF
eukprot:g44760.t1